MAAGTGHWGEYCLGSIFPGVDESGVVRDFPLNKSTGDPINSVLDLPFDENFTYLVEVKPIDISAGDGSTVTLRFSNNWYKDPTTNTVWEGALRNPYSMDYSMFESGRITGSAIPNQGEISLVNTQGELDYILTDYNWNGVEITCHVGLKSESFSDGLFRQISKGLTETPDHNTTLITIPFRDKSILMETDAQEKEYNGMGWGLDIRDTEKASITNIPLLPTQAWTIEALVRIDDIAHANRNWIFGTMRDRQTASYDGFCLFWGGSAEQIVLRFSDTTNFKELTVSDALVEGQLHRVSLVYNGELPDPGAGLTADAFLYVDGEQIGTIDNVSNPVAFYSADDPLTFGESDTGGNDQGTFVSDVRIWNLARTQSEIQEHMWKEIDLPLAQKNLIYYWKMNEGAGTTTFSEKNTTVGSDHLDLSAANISMGDNFDWDADSTPDTYPNASSQMIEILARVNSNPSGDAPIVAKKAGSGTGNAGFAMWVNSSGQLRAAVSDGTNQETAVYDGDIADGVVRRYTLILNAGFPQVVSPDGELWMDGVFLDSFGTTTTITGPTTNAENFTVGGTWSSVQLDMDVCDIRVWNFEFGIILNSGNEFMNISDWMWQRIDLTAIDNKYRDMHYWKCDDGSGTTVADTGGASTTINGTLSTPTGVWQTSGLSVARDMTVSTSSWSSTFEGTQDLAGKKKPLCFGSPYGVQAHLIDPKYLVYQLSSDALTSVVELREGANPIGFDVDTTDIYRTAVTAGEYTSDLSRGLIRISTEPTFPLEADVTSLVPSLDGQSSTSLSGDIVRALAARNGTITDPTEVDISSFNELAESGYEFDVGIATSTSRVSKAKILSEQLAPSFNGFWGFTRNGLLTVGVVTPAENPDSSLKPVSHELTDDHVRNQGLSTIRVPIPTHTQRVGYKRQHYVLTPEQVTGTQAWDTTTGIGDLVARVTEEYRFAEKFDSNVETMFPDSEIEEIATALINREDARAIAELRMSLYGVYSKVYELDIIARMFTHNINEFVSFTFPRFDLTKARGFITIGWKESAGSQVGSERLKLQIWGRV